LYKKALFPWLALSTYGRFKVLIQKEEAKRSSLLSHMYIYVKIIVLINYS
jgi:hypothetical protein